MSKNNYLDKALNYFKSYKPENPNTEKELETRVYLDPRGYRPKLPGFTNKGLSVEETKEILKKVINYMSFQEKDKYHSEMIKLENTMNFITSGDFTTRNFQNKIKQITFDKHNKPDSSKDKYYIKKTIMPAIFFGPCNNTNSLAFKLSLAEEIPIGKFEQDNVSLIRIKTRLTFFLKKWRLDITLTKSIKNIDQLSSSLAKNIDEAKNNMFLAKNTDDLFKDLDNMWPWDYAEKMELEFEALDVNKMEVSDFKIIDDFFKHINTLDKYIDSKNMYQHYLWQSSKAIWSKKSYKFQYSGPGSWGLKQLSNQVIELSRKTYFEEIYPYFIKSKAFSKLDKSYYLTDKADGKRAIVYVNNNKMHILTDEILTISFDKMTSSEKEIAIEDCEFKEDEEFEDDKSNVIIFDAEYLKKNDKPKLYIFDVMMYKGNKLVNQGFDERIKYIDKIIKIPNWRFKEYVESKYFVKLGTNHGDYKKEILKLYNRKNKPYPIDGLIFTPNDEPYKKMKVYKWKPLEFLTVDFLVRKCPKRLLGIKPYVKKPGYDLYLLFVGITQSMFNNLNMNFMNRYGDLFGRFLKQNKAYFPVQFSPSECPYAYLYYHDSKTEKKIDLDQKVGEFRFHICDDDEKCPKDAGCYGYWELLKIREDRQSDVDKGTYYGNNYEFAEYIWQNYKNPLTLEDLTIDKDEYDKLNYFQSEDSDLHRPQRYFNSFVKSKLLDYSMEVQKGLKKDNLMKDEKKVQLDLKRDKVKAKRKIERRREKAKIKAKGGNIYDMPKSKPEPIKLTKEEEKKIEKNYKPKIKNIISGGTVFAENILDLGAGKGQDLFRIAKLGFKYGLFIDNDETALSELIRRKFVLSKMRGTESQMQVNIKRLNLLKNYKENIQKLTTAGINTPPYGFDVIICNFALHYLIPNIDSIKNILDFITYYIKPGGVFMFTAFDGEKVFNLLQKENNHYKVYEGDVLKYSIEAEYTSKRLEETGQKIKVLLPFSKGEYYTEYLVNNEFLEKIFKKYGYKQIRNKSFGTYLDQFKKENNEVYSKLTNKDKEYVSLYHTVVYQSTDKIKRLKKKL